MHIPGKTLKELQELAQQIGEQTERDKEIFRNHTPPFLRMPNGPWNKEDRRFEALEERLEKLEEMILDLQFKFEQPLETKDFKDDK